MEKGKLTRNVVSPHFRERGSLQEVYSGEKLSMPMRREKRKTRREREPIICFSPRLPREVDREMMEDLTGESTLTNPRSKVGEESAGYIFSGFSLSRKYTEQEKACSS